MRITRRSMLGGVASLGMASAFGISGLKAESSNVLIVTCQNDAPNLDPHVNSDDPSTLLLRNIYDTLVRVAGNPAKVIPSLATEWTVSEDGTEYVFRLNPKAKFHDGSPVTSKDVAYSFDRLLRLKLGSSWMIAGIVEPGSVEAAEPGVVKIKLASPFAPFLSVLPWIRVANSAAIEANKGEDDGQTYLRTATAGSGPFRLVRAEPGNLYQLERVADDWHEGGGNLAGAIVRIVRESSRQRLMLQAGEAHAAINLSADDIDQLKGRSGIVTLSEFEYKNFSWKLNCKHGPFTDPNMRKAVNFALNYDALLGVSGAAKRTRGPLYEGLFGFDAATPVYQTDLAKAKELLAKTPNAGGGLKLVATHITGHEQQRRWTLVLLDSLRGIGIDLDVRPVTWPDMVALTRSAETCPDFFPVISSANYADPDDAAFAYHSSRNGGFANPTYANPTVDDLIIDARREVDTTRRAALYQEFQAAVVEDAPDILGVVPVRPLGFSTRLTGYEYTPVRAATFDFLPLSLS